jgi:hypothetical protein
MLNPFHGFLMVLLCLSPALHSHAQSSDEDNNYSINSYVNPEYKIGPYESILVYAPDVLLDQRKDIEGAVVKKLQGMGLTGVSAIEIIPPTNDDDASERNAEIQKSGTDATIIINTKSLYVESRQHQSRIISRSSRKIDSQSGEIVADPDPPPPILRQGDFYEVPVGNFSIRLISNSDLKTAWKATIHIKGDYQFGLSAAALMHGLDDLRKLGLL